MDFAERNAYVVSGSGMAHISDRGGGGGKFITSKFVTSKILFLTGM